MRKMQENDRVRTAGRFYLSGRVIAVEGTRGTDRVKIQLDQGNTVVLTQDEAIERYPVVFPR
jgi:preprotein translocase subunit YajC